MFFHTKNSDLGISGRALECKMLVYYISIWNISQPFGIFYANFGIFCGYLEYFVVIWNIFLSFGMLRKEKSGNPGPDFDWLC
jgi:hypothetical protein